jgi:cysteine desulfurase
MDPIYLDYNATSPLDPEVVRAMQPCLTGVFGNPSSPHAYGVAAKDVVLRAREDVARSIGAQPSEIVFTSGGSEANNLAIKGVAGLFRRRGGHIITSAVEHPAVTEVLEYLDGMGYRSTLVGVDATGRVDPAEVEAAILPSTILITVMHANNEVGTIEPIAEIAKIAKARGIPMHTDAAQSFGKIPVNVRDLGVDLLSLAGHKVYGPKGVGALFVRHGVYLEKQMHGAGHEGGRRAGTENLILLAGLGRACALAAKHLEERAGHTRELRDRLHDGLGAGIPGLVLNGHPGLRLPNTLNVSIPKTTAVDLLARIPEIAASAGAACHSGEVHISATLAAMGLDEDRARGAVRFSTGMLLTETDVDRAVAAVLREVAKA